MRTLFVIESLQLAGAERVVLELAQQGRRNGIETSIVTLRETETLDAGQYADVETFALFRAGEFQWARSALGAALRLRRILAELQPDVVAIHSPKVAVVAAMAGIRIPTLWVLHGHDVCWDGATLRRRISRTLQRWTWRRLGGRAAAVSASLADHAAAGLGVAREMITVISNGLDTKRFRFEEKIPDDAVTVCVLGRLDSCKRPLQALNAFDILRRTFPAARLWFVGDGPMREELAIEVMARGLSNAVHFWGMLWRPEEPLRKATVLWMASESEGMPVACLEAMASGVPVLGFDVRGVHDLLDGGRGILVAPKDTSALAKETALLVRDCERYRAIAQAARSLVEQQYSLETMCAGHYNHMRSFCAEESTETPLGATQINEVGTERSRT